MNEKNLLKTIQLQEMTFQYINLGLQKNKTDI